MGLYKILNNNANYYDKMSYTELITKLKKESKEGKYECNIYYDETTDDNIKRLINGEEGIKVETHDPKSEDSFGYWSISWYDNKEIENKAGCPYCGHDGEDKYVDINRREINSRIYDTRKCTKCGNNYDEVFNVKFLRSEKTRSSADIIAEDKYDRTEDK